MISNVISIENMLDDYGEEATVALLSSFFVCQGQHSAESKPDEMEMMITVIMNCMR